MAAMIFLVSVFGSAEAPLVESEDPMANIPQVNVGGIVYNLKDKEAREQVSDLKSTLNNQTLFTMEYLTGDSTLPLIAGQSSAGDKIARRMTTDFIPITKDFEIFLDEDENIVSFNIELYDASLNVLGDAIPNYKTHIKKIIFCRSNFPTAKYMKIWVCDWSNETTDLTSEKYEYAKQHIIIRPYITVKKQVNIPRMILDRVVPILIMS